MKKIILLALLGAPLLGWAQAGNFQLTGTVGNYSAPAKIYLLYFQGDRKVRDSAVIEHGSFRLAAPLVQPARALLILDHSGKGAEAARYEKNSDQITICLETGPIRINAKDSVKNAVVSSSKLNAEYESYMSSIAGFNQAGKALKEQYAAASAGDRITIDAKATAASRQKREVQLAFIRQHPDSYVSILALSELAGYNVGRVDVAQVEPLYTGLSPAVRQTIEGADLAKLLSAAKSFAIGAMAPGFTQNDVNGLPVALAGFRGKYVFIDFWASWAPPSREEHPNLVKLYDHYKARNFTVLGVGLEQPEQKEEWLAAIKADGLPWTQVTDFKQWKNEAAQLYHVGYLPANYLIGPDGRIIAKNLYGEKLNEKLETLIGK